METVVALHRQQISLQIWTCMITRPPLVSERIGQGLHLQHGAGDLWNFSNQLIAAALFLLCLLLLLCHNVLLEPRVPLPDYSLYSSKLAHFLLDTHPGSRCVGYAAEALFCGFVIRRRMRSIGAPADSAVVVSAVRGMR